jgi:hypothetical protein
MVEPAESVADEVGQSIIALNVLGRIVGVVVAGTQAAASIFRP